MTVQIEKTRIDKLVHDARGPLNAIAMNAELAQLLSRGGTNPERLQQSLLVIVRECQRCSQILQEFRAEATSQQGTAQP
jgi:His Kinase A (phosphoacceptor) domain.